LCLFLFFVGHLFKSHLLSPLLFLAITSIDMFAGALNSVRTTSLWSKVFPTIGQHEAQIEFSDFRAIATLAVGLVSLRDTSMIITLMQKMPDVAKSVSTWCTWIIDKCWIFFTNRPFFLDTEQKDELESYCQRLVEHYRNPDNKKLMLTSEPLGRLVRSLGRQAPGWKTALAQLRGIDTHWYNHMMTLMNNIITDAELVRTTGIAVTQRVEPTVLFLNGMGGQGKGASMQLFPKAIYEVVQKMCPEVYPETWNPTMCFTKAKNSDFWEGYDQNFCVVNDEMLAVTDTVSRGEECAEFLNMIDTNPMSLNMAFGSKGQNYFTSPLVIVSTNVTDNEIKSAAGMTSPPSFFRRKHINVTVSRNEHVDDVLANENYQRAWHYTEYFDDNEGSVQKLAMQDQVRSLCEHGMLCSRTDCSDRHVETYYELLKRKKVMTSNFKEIVYRTAMEIVRKYRTTSSLRARLAQHEFFPEISRVDQPPPELLNHTVMNYRPDINGNKVVLYFEPKTMPNCEPPKPLVCVANYEKKPFVVVNQQAFPECAEGRYEGVCEDDQDCVNPICPYHHLVYTNSIGLPVYEEKVRCIKSNCTVDVRPDMGAYCPRCWKAQKNETTSCSAATTTTSSITSFFPKDFATKVTPAFFPKAEDFVVHPVKDVSFQVKPKSRRQRDTGAGVNFHASQGWEDFQAKRNNLVLDDELRLKMLDRPEDFRVIDVVADDNQHQVAPNRFAKMWAHWWHKGRLGSVNEDETTPEYDEYRAKAIMLYGSSDQVSTHLYNNEYTLNGCTDQDTFEDRMLAKMFQMSHSPSIGARHHVYNFLMDLLILKRVHAVCTPEQWNDIEEKAQNDPGDKRLVKMFLEFGTGIDSETLTHLFSDQPVVWYFMTKYWGLPFPFKPEQFFKTAEFGHWKARFDLVMNKKKCTFNNDLCIEQWKQIRKNWKHTVKSEIPSTFIFGVAQWLKKSECFSDWVSSQFYFTKWRAISAAVGVLLAAGIAWYFTKRPAQICDGDVNQINFVSDLPSEAVLASHDPQSLSKGFQARLNARRRVVATHDPQGIEIISESVMSQINNISNNMRTLTFHYGEHEQSTHALISGRRAFLYQHFFLVMGMNYDKVTVSNDKGITDVLHPSHVIVTMPSTEKDCAYVDFSHKVFAELPSLRKQFESKQHIKDAIASGFYKVSRLHRLIRGGTVVNYLAGGSKLSDPDLPSECNLVTMDGRSITQHITDYMYCVGSKGDPGYCSLPYVAYDTVTNNVYVIGFHIGRVGDDSLINVLSEEDLPRSVAYEAQGKFIFQKGLYMPPHVMDNLTPLRRQEYNGRLVSMGSLKKPSMIPSETNIIRSPFQGDVSTPPIYPVSTAPALLKKTDVEQDDGSTSTVHPLKNAIDKVVSAPVTMIDPKFVQFMDREPEVAFAGFFPNVRREFRMLTKFEAIERLDMQASISYWGKVHGFTKREQMYNKEIGWIHPDLDAAIDKTFKKMDKGYTLKQAMEACLKDETRDLPRVYAGKTRLFYVGCIVFLITTIMIMGDVIDFMKAHRATSDVCIGINPHGNEWEFLRKKLQSLPGGSYFAGDFSNFDTSIRQVFAYGLSVAVRWYVQWTDSKMNWYLHCITMASVGPLLIITSEVYFMNFANGSGQWMTGFLNSFGNCSMSNWFYRFVINTDFQQSPRRLELLTGVQDFLRRGFYGDDNAGCVHPELKGCFTMPRMSKFIRDNFGMTYTTPGKSACLDDYLEWNEIDFLCRKFQKNHGTHAPLSLDSIHGMVLWIRKPQRGVSIEQQLAINVEQACMEFYHYGRDRFEKEKLHLWKYCKQYGIPWTAKTFDEYHQRFADGILYC